jgi:hypothetical protein
VLENGVLLTRRWIAARERLCGCRHNGRLYPQVCQKEEAVEEVPWDALPTELRMLVLGLPDPEGCYGRAEPPPTDQEDDDMRKPWEEEGISRATWYRRHLQKRGETVPETERQTETVRQACEIETACETGAPSHVPALDETAPETMQPPDQPWRISEADAARRADQYRAARKDKGDLIATRALRWGLQDAGVLYEQLEREVDRIRALAASRH